MTLQIKPGWGRDQLITELVDIGLSNHGRLMVGAEIGVQSGEYSEKMLAGGIEQLWLVDLWAQQVGWLDLSNVHNEGHQRNLRDTLRRMEAFPFRSHILIGMSHEVAAQVPDESLDFCYIDANHVLDAVRLDLAAWYPKVKSGGIMCGHDFLDSSNCCGSEFGVETAVTEFCEANGIEKLYVCQTEPFPNWSFPKP